MKADNVNNPKHYQLEGIPEYEVIDFIRAILGKEGFLNYCKGNIIKYISRAENKGDDEDLRKAGVYANYIIDELGNVDKAHEYISDDYPEHRQYDLDRVHTMPNGDTIYLMHDIETGKYTYCIHDKNGKFILECKIDKLSEALELYREVRSTSR